jgi:hypothetical protein
MPVSANNSTNVQGVFSLLRVCKANKKTPLYITTNSLDVPNTSSFQNPPNPPTLKTNFKKKTFQKKQNLQTQPSLAHVPRGAAGHVSKESVSCPSSCASKSSRLLQRF